MTNYDEKVSDLLVGHRARRALRDLMAAGPSAVPAVRRGLKHLSPHVRAACCGILDHFLDETALPDLVETLSDEDASVRARALHTLACERCKEGACRPGEEQFLPIVFALLEKDPAWPVRLEAVKLLFEMVHRSPAARAAIEAARLNDPSPQVRKAATLRGPGGVMFMRTSPIQLERRRLRTSNARSRLRLKG